MFTMTMSAVRSIYDLSIESPSGELIHFEQFKDKVILVVNTATECGFTPQLKQLQDLHEKYEHAGLVIIGFPCNQFGSQEPRSNDEMIDYCELKHGVTFLLTSKVDVNGPHTDPVFKYIRKELPGFLGGRIKWNFTKFLITRSGKPFKRYGSTTKPATIDSDILELLEI